MVGDNNRGPCWDLWGNKDECLIAGGREGCASVWLVVLGVWERTFGFVVSGVLKIRGMSVRQCLDLCTHLVAPGSAREGHRVTGSNVKVTTCGESQEGTWRVLKVSVVVSVSGTSTETSRKSRESLGTGAAQRA